MENKTTGNTTQTFPESWRPTKVDAKSGWKNRSAMLAEIAFYVNENVYVEDESELMEKLDYAIEYLKERYKITLK